jgi:hypothetical protein
MSVMSTIESASSPREELDQLNAQRAQWGLPTFVGFKTKHGYQIGWDRDAEPIYEITGGADGIFYRDLREPHIVVDESAITLATTQKALWAYPRTVLPANYWRVGKVVKLTAFGKATTDGTAGNYVFGLGYGSSDAPAVTIVGASVAGTVSQTNITWVAEAYMECRAIGTSGTARLWGRWMPAVALLASTLQPYLFPGSAPADSTIDTTVGTNSPVFELQRSGAGVWTATTTNLLFEALN